LQKKTLGGQGGKEKKSLKFHYPGKARHTDERTPVGGIGKKKPGEAHKKKAPYKGSQGEKKPTGRERKKPNEKKLAGLGNPKKTKGRLGVQVCAETEGSVLWRAH